MNLNPIFIEFGQYIKLPIEQDAYEGSSDKYFVFSYEDEAPTLHGDDQPLQDTAYMNLRLYSPKNFDYFDIKKRTTTFFESRGFIIPSKRTWLEPSLTNEAQKIRCTLFEMNYTGTH